MLNRSLLPNPSDWSHLFSFNGEGEGGGSGGGGGGGDDGKGNGGGSDDKDEGGGTDGPKFTQADIDRAASARAAEAKRKAEKDIADALGVSIEDAKRIIDARKADEDKDKSEAQRAKDEADAAKAEATREREAAKQERFEAKVERLLVRSKVNDKDLDDAMSLLKVADDATDDELKDAIEALVKRRPEMFDGESGEGGGGNGTPPPGDPKGKPRPKGAEDAFKRGEERAKAAAGGGSTHPLLESVK